MQINSTDPSRSRSIEDLDEPSNAAPAGKATIERAHPDWDRRPTLDTAALSAIQSGGGDSKALTQKLDKLQTDLKELRDALGPYSRECAKLHHALHELNEAREMIEHGKMFGPLMPAVAGLAILKAKHAVHEAADGWKGMFREAPEAARKAEPALNKVVDDVKEIIRTIGAPHVERPVALRG